MGRVVSPLLLGSLQLVALLWLLAESQSWNGWRLSGMDARLLLVAVGPALLVPTYADGSRNAAGGIYITHPDDQLFCAWWVQELPVAIDTVNIDSWGSCRA